MKMIKKLALFFILKITEITAVIYLPHLLGHLYNPLLSKILKENLSSFWNLWFLGIFGSVVVALLIGIAFLILTGILKFINFNWKLVNNGKGINWIENCIL